jgi:hypothetical protein
MSPLTAALKDFKKSNQSQNFPKLKQQVFQILN